MGVTLYLPSGSPVAASKPAETKTRSGLNFKETNENTN
jgi:hypothetical protein